MWQQLKLILWKNLLIRKRHYLLTIIEATVPVLLFFFIAYARSKIDGFTRIDINQTTYFESYPTKLMQLPIGEFSLWYTPQNKLTEEIINRVQIKSQIPGEAIRGFSDNVFMHMAMQSLGNKTVFAIQFNGDDPKKLNYDLRIYEKFLQWNTDMLYNPLAEPGTGSFKYIERGFIAMQIAINMAFIELSLGLYENQNLNDIVINLEEFPYPPHRSDSALNNLFIELLPLMTIFSFIFLCPAVLKRVVEEKASGIKELMKMVGMESWMIWLSWYIHAFVANLPAIIAIVVFMKIPMFNVNYPPIEYCSASVLFIFLLLYCVSAISFCFFIASNFKKPSLALIFGILAWLLTYFIPKAIITDMDNVTIIITTLLSIFPNMALHFGYKIIAEYEMREIGASWSNLFKSASDTESDVTLGYIFILFILETILYLCLTIYIDNIRPGEYGIAKPFNYPYHYFKKFIKQILNKLRNNSQINDECESLNMEDERKCIEVINLKKNYGSKSAVDGLTFDIYKNQITVLLGHNGAGKTTTMSIITGMLSATSGVVRINGINIKDHMNDVRKYLGLCPQHNLVFPDLTVDEHLRFFAMLKGASYQEAKIQSQKMLETLNLLNKKQSLASTLSGGMKRKLCLGMSLMGNSSVLILDEPTAGIDPESRRKLWNLLLELRKTRTILISTHFMDEADALADYILIMANGYKQCFGTPLELKKKYGTGYLVNITFNANKITIAIKDDVKSIINQNYPQFEFVKEDGDKFIWRLPFTCKEIYQDFFKDFEQKKTDYHIVNMSLTITTLQDVFMRTRKELDSSLPRRTQSSAAMDVFEEPSGKQKTISTSTCVVNSLIYKRILFLKKNGLIYLPGILLFLMTVLATLLLGKYSGSMSDFDEVPLKLDLTTYGRTGVYYSGTNNSQQIDKIKQYYKNEILQQNSEAFEVDNVRDAIANKGIENIAYYKKHMIIGGEFTERNGEIITTAYYSTHALHSAPISMNLLMNSIIKMLLNDSYSIKTTNHPLPIVNTQLKPSGEQSEVQVTLLWLILVPIGMLFLMGNFIIFPHAEVSTNFLHLQFVCGVTSKLYWLTNFIFDYLFCIIQLICILFVVYLFRYCPYIQVFNINEILAVFAIFAAYSFGQIPIVYLFSRRKTISGGFSLLLMSGMLCGTIFTVIIAALESSPTDYYRNLGKIFKDSLLIVCPQFGLSYIGIKFARKYVQNYNWIHMADDKKRHLCLSNFNPCCGGADTNECLNHENYFTNKELGIRTDLLLMLLSFIFYMGILLFMDSIKCKVFFTKLQTFIRQHLTDTKHNKDTAMPQIVDSNDNNLCVQNVKKTYGLFRTIPAVRNTSFTVRKGECYGLLGVNGAGKSTTFMMLTKDIIYDEGEINLHIDNGEHLSIQNDQYFNSIGYCPQMDALNCSLTGEQLLTIVAMLKGYDRIKAQQRAKIFLDTFDLTEYKDKKCSTYSGGNLRKLSTSLAFIGEVDIVLLDEPTTGVDPASRQNFWDVLLKFKNKHRRSFVLCSHSMEECEVLCDRIGIMKGGRIESEGTLDHLRQLHQKGYNIMLKLRNTITDDDNNKDCVDGVSIKKNLDTDSQRKLLTTRIKNTADIRLEIIDDSPATTSTTTSNEEAFQNKVEELADDLKQNFEKFTVKDQHGNMMYCHVNNQDLQLSDIFRKMEELKNKHPVIDDYTVTNASLEDVFLTVAQ